MSNPVVNINQKFRWAPPAVGNPAVYRVAVDDLSLSPPAQLNPPGTVEVMHPSTEINMSVFMTGKQAGPYAIYVAAVTAGGVQGAFLVQNFDYVDIGPPQPVDPPFVDA